MVELRYVVPFGAATRGDEHLFSLLVEDWEHEGVASELVWFARPLLEGSAEQQEIGVAYLGRVRGRFRELPMLLEGLEVLLAVHGLD